MMKIAQALLLLFGLLSLSYGQSYDKLKEIQTVSSNSDFIKLREVLGDSLGDGRIIIRSGTICDGKVNEDRLSADVSKQQVEYTRVVAKQSDFNFEKLSLTSESGYIKIKDIIYSI